MLQVTLIAAQSLDGFITRHQESGTGFCSPEDAAYFTSALRTFDSLVMGRKTFDTLRPLITGSRSIRYLRKIVTRSPEAFQDLAKPELIEFTASPAEAIVKELAHRGRQNCALLGGSEIYSSFLELDLVDALWITIEPLIFGSGTPIARGKLNNHFQLNSVDRLGPNTLLLKYSRVGPPPVEAPTPSQV